MVAASDNDGENVMGPSVWQMLIVLAIVIVLFGTKKLRNIGGDMGAAINNFREAVKGGEGTAMQEPKKLFEQVSESEDRQQS